MLGEPQTNKMRQATACEHKMKRVRVNRKGSVSRPAQAAARVAWSGCQFQGRSSAMRRAGCEHLRADARGPSPNLTSLPDLDDGGAFPQHHDMVEALASDRADQPFDMPVLPR